MAGGSRSPFGSVLRAYRQQRGLSQSALADRIAERFLADPTLAALGMVSDKAIANLERIRSSPDTFVRPRPQTVRILAAALDLVPGSEEERAFFAAAEKTRIRPPARQRPSRERDRPLFVRAGRERQLARLHDAWSRAVHGDPGIILIAGDAGAGKTELTRNVCIELQQFRPATRIAWGECTSGALAVDPYLPILQAMNMILGLVTRDDDPAIPSAALIARQVSTIDDLLGIAPTIIGSLVDEQALRDHIDRLQTDHPHLRDELQRALGVRFATESAGQFDQLTRFLTTTARATPVLLVLEDLHWASDQVIALLLHLQKNLRHQTGVQLLIIGTFRPSDLTRPEGEPRHPLKSAINEMRRLSGDVVVDLGSSIGTAHGRAFINGLLREMDALWKDEQRLATFLFERTEGHPLFAVELIQWLRETGKIAQDDAHVAHVDFSDLDAGAPVRIQSVIAERFARLPKNLRDVLDHAAIQGPIITIDTIPDTRGITGDEVAEIIEEHIAPRYQLLDPIDPVTIDGTRLHRYRFRHVLFQQYLYETLTPSRRERLHARTAAKMVSLFGDEPHAASGEIAFHFLQAHQHADATYHTCQAGVYALRRLNYEGAETWFRQAETMARDRNDERSVHAARNGLVSALRGKGAVGDAIALGQQVIADHQRFGFRDLEAEASDLLGQAHFDRGNLHEAVACLKTAASIHLELGQLAEASGSESMLSHAYYRLGAYDDALAHARAAWQAARALGHTAFEAEALLAAGNCEIDLGMYETAIATYAEARSDYTRAHEVRGEILCDLNTSLCFIQLRRWDEALQVLHNTRDLTTTLRAPRLTAFACYYLGLAYEGKGDIPAAREALDTALEIRRRLGQVDVSCDIIAAQLRLDMTLDDYEAMQRRLPELASWIKRGNGEGIEDPIGAWLTLADAYDRLSFPESRDQALRDGHALLKERASRLANPEARHSYLTNVPANRRLLDLSMRISSRTADD